MAASRLQQRIICVAGADFPGSPAGPFHLLNATTLRSHSSVVDREAFSVRPSSEADKSLCASSCRLRAMNSSTILGTFGDRRPTVAAFDAFSGRPVGSALRPPRRPGVSSGGALFGFDAFCGTGEDAEEEEGIMSGDGDGGEDSGKSIACDYDSGPPIRFAVSSRRRVSVCAFGRRGPSKVLFSLPRIRKDSVAIRCVVAGGGGRFDLMLRDDVPECHCLLVAQGTRVHSYDLARGGDPGSFRGSFGSHIHHGSVRSIDVSSGVFESEVVASGGSDAEIWMWDRKSRQKVRVYFADGAVLNVAFVPDTRVLISGLQGGGIQTYDLRMPSASLASFNPHRKSKGKASGQCDVARVDEDMFCSVTKGSVSTWTVEGKKQQCVAVKGCSGTGVCVIDKDAGLPGVHGSRRAERLAFLEELSVGKGRLVPDGRRRRTTGRLEED